jgi:hypothetical protein
MPGPPPFDLALLDCLPGVLAIPLKAFAAEDRAELRLHRLCDAFEVLTRFGTILVVAEVRLPDDPSRLPAALVEKIGPQIEMPTFGRWLAMAGDLADFLSGDRSSPMVLPELPRFLRHILLKAAPPGNRYLEESVLELRNTLAHGALPAWFAWRRCRKGGSATNRITPPSGTTSAPTTAGWDGRTAGPARPSCD